MGDRHDFAKFRILEGLVLRSGGRPEIWELTQEAKQNLVTALQAGWKKTNKNSPGRNHNAKPVLNTTRGVTSGLCCGWPS